MSTPTKRRVVDRYMDYSEEVRCLDLSLSARKSASRLRPCSCEHYCGLRAKAMFNREHDHKVQDLGYGRIKEARLQFCGLEVILNANGTYEIGDTAGG